MDQVAGAAEGRAELPGDDSHPEPALRRLLDGPMRVLDGTIRGLTRLLLVGITGIILVDIVARLAIGHTYGWIDEYAGFGLQILVIIGGARSLGAGHLPRISVAVDALPPPARDAAAGFVRITTVAFGVFLTISGWQFAQLNQHTKGPISGIALFYPDLAFPVAGVVLLAYAAYELAGGLSRWELLGGVVAVLFAVAVFGRTSPPNGLGINGLLVLVLIVLLLVGCAIPLALAVAAWTAVSMGLVTVPTNIVTQQMSSGLSNFILVAVPLFLFTGALMHAGGVADRLVSFAESLFSWMPRGLGTADLFASAVFADMSGSAVADAAALGHVMIPRLEASGGFTRREAAGLQAAAGSLGILFPPSVTIILYSFVTNQSLKQMFLALILPGLIVVVAFALVLIVTARRAGVRGSGRPKLRRVGTSFLRATPGLATLVIVLGGIIAGIGTTTEIGAVAAAYTLLVSVVCYRGLTWRSFVQAMDQAVENTCRVLFVLASAIAVAFVLTSSGAPQDLVDSIGDLTTNKLAILFLLAGFLIVLHLILESSATILVVMPVILPLLTAVGISPIQFGVVLNLTTALALITPPLGLCLIIISSVASVGVLSVARAAIPYALALVAVVVIAILAPSLSTALPSLVR